MLIRPGAIGDCILSLPVLKYLAAGYTEVWISSAVVPLVQFADQVCAISSTGIELMGVGDVPVPPLLCERLKAFDSVISWYGTNRGEFRDALSQLGVQCMFFEALPPSGYKGHALDFFAAQAGAPKLEPKIHTASCAKQGFIAIHPFSGSERKNWPLEYFEQLARRLPLPVRWTCGPEESVRDAVRFENLADLANWLSGANLFIGNDSGIAHLAAATGMPVLALFGPTNPAIWAPRGAHVSVLRKEPLNELSVEAVLDGANRLLGSS